MEEDGLSQHPRRLTQAGFLLERFQQIESFGQKERHALPLEASAQK